MPLLPRKNTLDYNPDSTINASKKIRAIALERMKNPTEDPDQATLSTLDAQKSLGSNIDRLLEMASSFHTLILRIQNLLSPAGAVRRRGGRMIGGAGEGDDVTLVSSDDSSSLSEYRNRLASDRTRFRRFYDDDSRNSTATPYSSSSGLPDFDGTESLPSYAHYHDDDPEPELSLPDAGVSDTQSWVSLIFNLINLTRRMNIVVSSTIKPITDKLSTKQIQVLTRIYLMVRSSYDDITRPLSRRTVDPVARQLLGESMRDPFTGVRRIVNPNVFQEVGFGNVEQNLMRENQYGDEILVTFDTARRELLLSLTVIINSWKQNTPTGQQTELGDELERDFQRTATTNRDLYNDYALPPRPVRNQAVEDDDSVIGSGRKPRGRPRKKDTMTMTMVGNGRNFYGEPVNNSRDLPTIWRNYRDCPTKYLL